MIEGMSLLKLVEHLKTRICEYSDDGFYYDDIVSEQTIEWIEKCVSLGLADIDVEVEGVAVDSRHLQSKIHWGKKCRVVITTYELRGLGLCIYKDWKEFFKSRKNAFKVPDQFYVFRTDDFKVGGDVSSKANHLLQLSSLLNLLISFADYSEEISPGVVTNFVFLHKKRLNINVDICEGDISEALDGITILLSKLNDESHSEQKKSILKEVLSGMVVSIDEGDRLRYLVENFGVFSQRFSENYDFFVSEFSFDDVRLEYEEKKRDYMSKLNDIFSSSLTKMIGVPISLALISFKMSVIVGDVTFFTNLMLFFAVAIYVFMMIILIKNQKHTLTALKLEYTGQMNRLKFSFSEQYDLIEKIVEDLDDRGDFQRECLNWYYVAVAVLALCVSGLFLYNLPWKAIML